MTPFLPVEHDPFTKGELECVFPTTLVQREILVGAWLGGEDANRAFNECLEVQLRGPLVREALEAAYRDLVQGHDILRTTFNATGEQGFVRFYRGAALPFFDVSPLSREARDVALHAIRSGEATKAFDLNSGPLHRIQLVAMGHDDYRLFFSAHHAICDWWTTGVLMRNLGLHYNRHRGEPTDPISAPSYAHHAREQKRLEESAVARADLDFWRSALRGYDPNWSLPLDHQRPAERTYLSRRVDVGWTDAATTALRTLAKTHRCTLTGAFLGVLQTWLYLKTQACDVIIGVPAAGQVLSSDPNLAGHCVHLLPVRLTSNPDMSVASLIQECKTNLVRVLEHRTLTYSQLLEEARYRSPGRPPLIQMTANVDMGLTPLDFVGLSVEYATLPRLYDAFELAINVVTRRERLTVQAQFNRALFVERSVRQWIDEWADLTQVALGYPNLTLRTLSDVNTD